MLWRAGFTVLMTWLRVGCLLLTWSAFGADYYVDVDSRGGRCDDAGKRAIP
jgi:hypothetical protein